MALIGQLAERAAEEGEDGYGGAAGMEELVRHYEQLLLKPLNLNAATRKQLEETQLLTLFQVESLLAWRERYAALRSATEWALVEGFSPEVVAQLHPFFTLGEPQVRLPATQTYSARFKKKWRQEGFSLATKGWYESETFTAGAVVENDPKERFPDFVSLSASCKGWYAGDFTARFGQGLVLWKAFSMSAFGTPSSVARRGNGLKPYRSSSETGFFRGLGWTHDFGNVSVTALASRTPVDARIVEGRYTSIVTDGLHATGAERAKRHTMHEYAAGAHVALERARWHFGLTAAAYRYDKPNGRKVQDYNKYQQYDGWWGNLGADFYGAIGSLRLFGEAAVDAHGAPAALAGAVWSPSYAFETSLTARCYSPSYIATHAGACSTLGSVSNQIGVAYALQWIRGSWTMRLNADYAYYPWKRYRAEAGTSALKARLQAVRQFRGGAELEAQLAWSSRLKGRVRFMLPVGASWNLSARADANPGGIGGYLDARWHPARKWDIAARVSFWHTQDWDSRIYFYERGVPESFAIEPYAGKGVGAYLVVKYAPNRHFDCWLKLQQNYVSYFVRIFIPGRMTLLAFRPLSL